LNVLALDTSVAIPLLVRTHGAHDAVTQWWAGREVVLCGHALIETYSVLTRLPGDIRLDPADASHLLTTRFSAPLVLDARTARSLPATLAGLGIAGGATYDALVGLTAAQHGAVLATRDNRARSTYEAVGAQTVIAG
jgi:predicted nucleic acid-binding protein